MYMYVEWRSMLTVAVYTTGTIINLYIYINQVPFLNDLQPCRYKILSTQLRPDFNNLEKFLVQYVLLV